VDSPLINFLGAIGIGLVIGLIGAFVLRGKQPTAMWLAPALAIGGALVASVLALIFGNDADYGWKEPILQVVLAAGGVAATMFLGSKKSASTPSTAGAE
jgi:uncharacterized membrane protein YeaQ/YmgE (transglycosylase-associated protein family)